MTLAVRCGERLVGSIEFYAFDFHGSAELDVRIFPHEQGKHFASGAVEGAIEIARQMGLLCLSAVVMNNNAPSLALFEKYAKDKKRDRKTTTFTLDI
jgi:RimJ/RimL family protein N-acetyltransferase